MSYRPSPSMMVSLLALVVALGGVALAANDGPWLLSANNTAAAQTALAARVSGRTLRITNSSNRDGATALGLFVKDGNPPLTVNSNALVEQLNADLIDGLHADELVRVGSGGSEVTTSNVTFTTLVHVDLDIPASGFVLLTSQAQFKTQSSACAPCYVHFRFHDQTATTTPTSPVQIASIGFGTTDIIDVPGSATWVFPVTAGPRTFALESGTFPSTASIAVVNPVITALFIPFGPSGAAQTAAATPNAAPAAPVRFGPLRSDGSRAIIR